MTKLELVVEGLSEDLESTREIGCRFVAIVKGPLRSGIIGKAIKCWKIMQASSSANAGCIATWQVVRVVNDHEFVILGSREECKSVEVIRVLGVRKKCFCWGMNRTP